MSKIRVDRHTKAFLSHGCWSDQDFFYINATKDFAENVGAERQHKSLKASAAQTFSEIILNKSLNLSQSHTAIIILCKLPTSVHLRDFTDDILWESLSQYVKQHIYIQYVFFYI